MIDFSVPPELEATRQHVIAFMDQHVYPNESKLVEDEGLSADLERELQKTVKEQGLWAPNLPTEWGGMGIGYIGQALVNEIIGRSVIGPRLFGNAAPDAGNAELLIIAATTEQKEQYLRPLAAGEVRILRNFCPVQSCRRYPANLLSLRQGPDTRRALSQF